MPTEIWTATDLDNVRNDLAGNYIQMADIDMDGVAFDPIGETDSGDFTGYAHFTGVYDGNNKKIINLTIEEPTGSNYTYTALFRVISGASAEVKNLTLENCFILGRGFVAGIAGSIYGGYFYNLKVTGEIVAEIFGAGIAPYVYAYVSHTDYSSQVSFVRCRVEGIIRGPGDSSHFAGIAAGGFGSIIVDQCSALVEIIGPGSFAGGIGGEWESYDYVTTPDPWLVGAQVSASQTTQTYAKAIIHTSDSWGSGQELQNAAGLFGRAKDAHIEDCYGRMEIARTGEAVAESGYGVSGLVGEGDDATTINCYSASVLDPGIWSTENSSHFMWGAFDFFSCLVVNCYADSEISGVPVEDSLPEGLGLRDTGEMVYPYTEKHVSGTYVDWGFENNHITDLTDFDFVFGEPWVHDPTFALNDGYPPFEPTAMPVDPTLTKIADCYTPTNPLLSVSLDYGPFNNTVIERQDTMIAQYRLTNPPTGLTLKTKWRYLTPKLEHNVICGFECRGILIRYKLKGRKPKLIPEFE